MPNVSASSAASSCLASGVLYLHGFNSGSASWKAALVREACAVLGLPCEVPDLPPDPEQAIAVAESYRQRLGPCPLVVGSSMGGFIATLLAERHGLRAVLINPAVAPARLVAKWLGEVFTNPYSGEQFSVTASQGEYLAKVTPGQVDPARYRLLLCTADERLDSQDAFRLYRGASTILHPGGDHNFSMLHRYLPAVLAWGGHHLAADAVAPPPPQPSC
ncbi:YqiA/YcfP family alpha/beta fold hydrolase [Halomonas halocynthiae]|uniref:YqiA/YcfP family alpha/beta fold hydrolase n=1 Tax=Halomonas halocynthiae TaxID=176290 RepID=UPI0003FCACD8|nr:YqiA/YcfP family alpha/beta fold hydrolase [Halomonas halocynthiae]